MSKLAISRQAIRRLPDYLQYLRTAYGEGRKNITATAIAQAMQLNEVQVRKDIAAVSSHSGKPMVGFSVNQLIEDIQSFLNSESPRNAILVGAGALGRALLGYGGFAPYGLQIAAAFDIAPAAQSVGQVPLYSMNQLEKICSQLAPEIGILTVPADSAQSVCDRLIFCGVKAIWNFSPTFLITPEDILVQNELLASSLAVIVHELQEAEQA